jgi:AraC family transcriptional regulator
MTSSRCVPVMMGASSFVDRDLAGFRVAELHFSPDVRLASHEHDRASFLVTLEGGFDLSMRGRTFACIPSVTTIEPTGTRHTNHISSSGARILVIQPDSGRDRLPDACRSMFSTPSQMKNPRLVQLAWSLAHELGHPAEASDLYVEGLVCEMLAHAVRRGARAARRPPPWLAKAEEVLRERFLDGVLLEDLARAAGVHRVHLVRTFRQHYGTSPGEYLRTLRLQWAAERLTRSDDSLGLIAHEAGFTDQSHFSRLFRRLTGITPGRYRQSRRR